MFWPPKVEKTILKSCSEFLKSTFFPWLPKWPKQKNSCSKMWPLDQLYIELGSKVRETKNYYEIFYSIYRGSAPLWTDCDFLLISDISAFKKLHSLHNPYKLVMIFLEYLVEFWRRFCRFWQMSRTNIFRNIFLFDMTTIFEKCPIFECLILQKYNFSLYQNKLVCFTKFSVMFMLFQFVYSCYISKLPNCFDKSTTLPSVS